MYNNFVLLSENQIIEVFEIFKKLNPAPKSELNYSNPFTLLVAVALSAQTTDKSVNKATEALFKIADTPEKNGSLRRRKACFLHKIHWALQKQSKTRNCHEQNVDIRL